MEISLQSNAGSALKFPCVLACLVQEGTWKFPFTWTCVMQEGTCVEQVLLFACVMFRRNHAL